MVENFDLQIPLLHMKAENQREKKKIVVLESELRTSSLVAGSLPREPLSQAFSLFNYILDRVL
jgi:hypothetical protein